MMDTRFSFFKTRYALSVIGALVLLIAWTWVSSLKMIKPVFLPSPAQVYNGVVELIEKGWLQKAIVLSTYRVLSAMFLVTLSGIIIGSLMGVSRLADGLLGGIISGLKSVPVTGFLGLVVLWFSIEERAKIIFLFLVSVFYMILLVRDALHNVHNVDYIDVAKDLGATNFQLFTKVLFPSALPQIYNAVIVSNSLMWSYIVLVEYINGNEEQTGLGYLIYISSRTQDSAKVFGLLIVIALIASLFDYILKQSKKYFIRWS
ncbi:MAG: ABC transporter permease [Chitinophagaceae bacterium]